MKATTLLERQHREVESIFKKLGKSGTDKPALLKQLADNFSAHMAIEQDIFYPAIKKIDPDLVNESYEEHSLAEVALKRLLNTDPDDETFDAHVTAMKELVQHHVEEEEEDLFPKCDKKLGKGPMEALGERMKAKFDQCVEQGYESLLPEGCDNTSADQSLERGPDPEPEGEGDEAEAAPPKKRAKRKAN